ncbi:MAG: ABC transporter ATP-binding protein/permease [Acidimicrobiia bacterium]|nr:ABC transporter ATP-binding protein/permease [Acidimicrobiia bacterium]
MTTDTPALRRLIGYARPHRRQVWKATAASILNKVFDLAPPLLIGVSVDIVVAQEDSFLAGLGVSSVLAQLWVLAAVTFVIWGLESLFEYLHGVWWRNLAQRLEHELRMDAYGHTQTLEMAYFEQQHTGELMAVLNDDVNQLERFLDHGANDLIQLATTTLVIGAVFFVVAPQVAWLAFLPMPLIMWGSFRFQKRIAPRYAEVRRRAGLINSRLANNLGGIATIKSFTAEPIETTRIATASDAYREANRSAIRLSSAFSPLIRMAIVVGFTATLVLGGYLVTEGDLDVGPYTVLVFLTQRLLWPLTRLGETVDLYHRAMASTTRILDVLDTEATIVDGPAALHQAKGDVSLANVSFAYDPLAPALNDLSFSVAAGETVGITGSTGSGKTTVIKLLLRFYDVDSGTVSIDGIDVSELKLEDLRRAIGLVSQDVYLFDGSISDNISYGRPGASRDDVVAAAAIAEAHQFIQELPQGYDTIVGERGQRLSGGQRQRVSLARAVLKDPPILVLDEATSSVDNETEAAIQRSLERLAVGRTTIIIAHRLSTIRNADRIYVLEDGRLVETGSHDELSDRGGVYANLWSVQTGAATTST